MNVRGNLPLFQGGDHANYDLIGRLQVFFSSHAMNCEQIHNSVKKLLEICCPTATQKNTLRCLINKI